MARRILQVVTDTDRRGAQVFAIDLHAAMSARGAAVRTVALAPGTVGGLDLPVLGSSRRSLSTLRALRAAIRDSDVVVAHGSTTLPMCAMATIFTGVPFVYRQISDSRFWASTRSRRWRVRLALSRASHAVALWSGSARALSELFGVPAARITVVPNGVPPQPFVDVRAGTRYAARAAFGLPGSSPVVLAIGALAPEKGVDLTIRAVGTVAGVSLLVVGDGPERGALERLAADVAPGHVCFAGSIDDPVDAYAAADVVVMPSRGGDSMPAVLIEAGLSGVPALATPIEGIPEIVLDQVTGVLVPVGDLDRLSTELRQLVEDQDRARRLGEAARHHCVEHFAIDVVAGEWLAVLDAVARA